MTVLLPFQVLPPHVVQLIVDHVAGSSRLQFAGITASSREYKALLKPLLWVCHNPRAIALARYCNYFKLEIGQSAVASDPKLFCRDSLLAQNYICYHTHRLAQELEIDIDETDIQVGRAIGTLSKAPYDGVAFPRVRRLICRVELTSFDDFHKYGNSPPEAETRINEPLRRYQELLARFDAFVQRIKEMVPMVKEIVAYPSHKFHSGPDTGRYFSYLVSHLYQLVGRVEYKCVSDFPDYEYPPLPALLDLSRISNLVDIKYSCMDDPGQFVLLAQLNAATLRSLIINANADTAIADYNINVCWLIEDTDGRYVTYPRLAVLKLYGPSFDDVSKRPVFNGAVTFPCLRCLCLGIRYPLDDDTIFRGNAATLECLSIQADPTTVSILRRCKTFTPSSHPKLYCVKIEDNGDIESDFLGTAAECIQLMLMIGPDVPVWTIGSECLGSELVPAITSLNIFSSIQILTLTWTHMSPWDAIALINFLPLLSDLHAPCPMVGTLDDYLALVDIPTYVLAKYTSTGSRFRCWHFERPMHGYFMEAVKAMLILALVCPNFDCFVPLPKEREPIMKLLEEAIATDGFEEYASRWRRFLISR